jgi:hypothetical protein
MLGSAVRRRGILGLSPAKLGILRRTQQQPPPQWFVSARDLFAARVLSDSRGASSGPGSGESSARPREQGSTKSSMDEPLPTHLHGTDKELPLPGSGREMPLAGMGRVPMDGQAADRPENAPSERKAFGSSRGRQEGRPAGRRQGMTPLRGAAAMESPFQNIHAGHSTRPYTLVQRSHEEVDEHAAMKRARANEQARSLSLSLSQRHPPHLQPRSTGR